MVNGYMGKILRVDLTKKELMNEELVEERILKKFLGTEGLASYYVYKEVPPGVDALDPGNCLAFMVGPFTGTLVPGSSTFIVCGKSPATGFTISSARSQGLFAPKLKFCGYDGIIVKGKSQKPVYLWIHEGGAEIRDASEIWGKDTYEATDIIKKELKDDKISVGIIGIAGENLIRESCIVIDKFDVAGRGGMGTVMGSKKLKAIAVSQGKKKVPGAEKEEFKKTVREWRLEMKEQVKNKLFTAYGTAGFVMGIYEAGDLPIKNFSTSILAGVEKLDGKRWRDEKGIVVKDFGCYACPTKCKKIMKPKTGPYSGKIMLWPTYEDIVAWGSNIGVTDPGVTAYGTELCNKLGYDCLAASLAVSFAIECFEEGILTEKDTDGLVLSWGDYKSAFKLVEKIAKREGFGDILAEGTKRAADSIGKGSEKFAVYIKNMAIPMHDLRAWWGYGLQYTVASGGPIHEGGFDYAAAYERTGKIRPFTIDRRGELVKKGQEFRTFLNCVGICEFSGKLDDNDKYFETLYRTISALTGWNMDLKEASKVAMRTINIRRIFNIRHGLKPEDDNMSPRLLDAPKNGPIKGHAINIKPMVRDYYKVMGWDEKTGIPLRRTLEELGLEDLIDDVWK